MTRGRRLPLVVPVTRRADPPAPDQTERPHRLAKTATARRNSTTRAPFVAGDFVDKGFEKDYVVTYKANAGIKGTKQPWAIHPYEAIYNRTRQGGYLAFLNATDGPVWLSEEGAMHHEYKKVKINGSEDNASPPSGDGRYYKKTANTTRQFNDLQFLLDRIVPYKHENVSRVTRLHYYQWADRDETHGSGLVRYLNTASSNKGQPYCLYLHRERSAAVRNSTCDASP